MRLGLNLQTKKPSIKSFDPDAKTYILNVEAVDGQQLETLTRRAIDDFVVGCKIDGIWDAIKACCVMAGARTLNGALVPLKGVAPTKFNFVNTDYARKTGLKGNGFNKYLNSNYKLANKDSNNVHCAVHRTEAEGIYVGERLISQLNGGYMISTSPTVRVYRANTRNSIADRRSRVLGFVGVSRDELAQYNFRYNSITTNVAITSTFFSNSDFFVFSGPDAFNATIARMLFYSIGESLDLTLLNNRVNTLMNSYQLSVISEQ